MKPFPPVSVESRASASPTVSSCKFRGYSRFHRKLFHASIVSFLLSLLHPSSPPPPTPYLYLPFRSLSTASRERRCMQADNREGNCVLSFGQLKGIGLFVIIGLDLIRYRFGFADFIMQIDTIMQINCLTFKVWEKLIIYSGGYIS